MTFKFFCLFFFFLGIDPLADRARYEASLLVSAGTFKEPIFFSLFGGSSNLEGSFESLSSRCAKFLSSTARVLSLDTISKPSSVLLYCDADLSISVSRTESVFLFIPKKSEAPEGPDAPEPEESLTRHGALRASSFDSVGGPLADLNLVKVPTFGLRLLRSGVRVGEGEFSSFCIL